jgi:hypothetical protein
VVTSFTVYIYHFVSGVARTFLNSALKISRGSRAPLKTPTGSPRNPGGGWKLTIFVAEIVCYNLIQGKCLKKVFYETGTTATAETKFNDF